MVSVGILNLFATSDDEPPMLARHTGTVELTAAGTAAHQRERERERDPKPLDREKDWSTSKGETEKEKEANSWLSRAHGSLCGGS